MRKRMLLAVMAAAIAVGTSSAIAASGDDGNQGVTGSAADRAAEAALAMTGGGSVDGVERDEGGGSAVEVEVTTPEGTSVEVLLDENFEPAGIQESEDDDDTGQDDDAAGQDDDDAGQDDD